MFKGNTCNESATQVNRRKLERQINILSTRQMPTTYAKLKIVFTFAFYCINENDLYATFNE